MVMIIRKMINQIFTTISICSDKPIHIYKAKLSRNHLKDVYMDV
jgi:hypothetical protein